MSNKIVPFQPSDFVRSNSGKVMYKGPVYALSYPMWCDGTQEIIDWSVLGFHAIGYGSLEQGHEFTHINVIGEIPVWLQERLQSAGVKINQTKVRGSEIPADALGLEGLAASYFPKMPRK